MPCLTGHVGQGGAPLTKYMQPRWCECETMQHTTAAWVCADPIPTS